MEKVIGIGGFFFRSDNPKALKDWYSEHLGIEFPIWNQENGPTVIAPFARSSDYFADQQQWMLNFRVQNLDLMIKQLESAGIEVITDPGWNSEVGRFARIHDPEGNPLELWEPADS
ncbi:MAG: glyoxalase [Leptospiraceae bacterium]|nr:glyoxalase [Leptospiraceae bacterium]